MTDERLHKVACLNCGAIHYRRLLDYGGNLCFGCKYAQLSYLDDPNSGGELEPFTAPSERQGGFPDKPLEVRENTVVPVQVFVRGYEPTARTERVLAKAPTH